MSHPPPRPGTGTRPFFTGAVPRLLAAAGAGAVLLPVVSFLLVGAERTALVFPLAGYLVAVALAAALMRRGYPYPVLGLGNLVTLLRLVLASALIAPLAAPGTVPAMVTVAILFLMLDGVDGWLARRQGRVSDFGARFDMEVDAAFGLILAINVWHAGTLGPEVMLLGLPRYLFAIAAWRLPWISRSLPERFGRKLVCVIQIAGLIALLVPALAGPPATVIFSAVLAALSWSFGRDLQWLWRKRT